MLTKFSIIIASARPANSVKSVLLDFEAQDYPRHLFEVIIIRNNEPEAIRRVKKPSFFLKIIESQIPGPSAARNLGIVHSQYETVICVDDDCKISANFLKLYHQAWAKFPQATIIGGKILPLFDQIDKSQQRMLNLFPWCFALVDYGARSGWLKSPETLMSANLSFKKSGIPKLSKHEIFANVLGTKLNNQTVIFGEDWELCLRVYATQGKIAYYPRIVVGNMIEPSRFYLSYLIRRFWLSGIERYRVESLLKSFSETILGSLEKEYFVTWTKKPYLLFFLDTIQLISYQLSKLNGLRYTTPRP